MPDPSIQNRHDELRERAAALGDHPDLDRPLSRWVDGSDRHLPQKYLTETVRRLLDPTYWASVAGAPGIGGGRLRKLLAVIGRALTQIAARSAGAVGPAGVLGPRAADPAFDPATADEADWSAWAVAIRRHRLEGLPLGRFAATLNDLPVPLWAVPLRQFLDQPLAEVRRTAGLGPIRGGQVVRAVAGVAEAVAGVPAGSSLACRPTAARLHRIACWMEGVLAARAVPTPEELDREFVRPMLHQLADDLSAEHADVIRRRWGVDGPPPTLQQLADENGQTRERIRQVADQAGRVLAVRWPEGRAPTRDLYRLVVATVGTGLQVEVIRVVADACFGLEFTDGEPVEIRPRWEAAGTAGRTPMTVADVRDWSAREFPHLPPDAAVEWVAAEAEGGGDEGGPPYFARAPYDRLLLDLIRRGGPLPFDRAVAAIGREEYTVRERLARDPRFIEDDRQVWASVHRRLERVGGEWVGVLAPDVRVPLAQLVHLTVGGLLLRGIADATVAGVHRAAGEIVRRLYGVGLPAEWTPVVFSLLMMRHSGGIVRTLRRRRLRWDAPAGDPPARGKHGWIAEVLARAGGPMTLDEMGDRLRDLYQDHEPYTLAQLGSGTDDTADGDDEAEDTPARRYRITAGVARRVPRLLIPDGWQPDADGATVSEGVRELVRRILAAKGGQRYSRAELREVDWLIRLCETEAGGPVPWYDGPQNVA